MTTLNSPKCVYFKNKRLTWKSQFDFVYRNNKLFSKNAKSNNDKRRFQECLLKAMKEGNRNTYKCDVAVSIRIFINQNAAPSIQNISKYYIDLICKFEQSNNLSRKYLLLKDDSQIKYLNVVYLEQEEGSESEIHFSVRPYSLFKERILIVKWHNFYKRDSYDEYIYSHDENKSYSNIEEYYHYLKNINETDEKYNFWRTWNYLNAQREYLNNCRIKHKSIVDIFYPNIPNEYDLSNILESNSDFMDWSDFIFDLNLGTFQNDFGNLPKFKDHKSKYLDKIRENVKDYIEQSVFMKTILNPIGLTVLVSFDNNRYKDLDNIVREIIKEISKLFLPPTIIANGLMEKELLEHWKQKEKKIEVDIKAKNFPETGFTMFNVFKLESNKDNVDEFVKLNIHNSDFSFQFLEYIDYIFLKMKWD